MKKMCIVSLLCACILLTSCTAPHLSESISGDSIPMPDLTPAPTVAPVQQPTALQQGQALVTDVSYDPECPPSALAAQPDFSMPLYVLLADAVRAGQDSVDLGEMTVTAEQLEIVRHALISRNVWGTLRDITRAEDGQLNLIYSTEEAEMRTAQVQELDSAVQRLLEQAASGQSQLAVALSLYKALAQNVHLDYIAEDMGIYGALTQGRATDYGFAYAYGFLLDQAGIENVVVTAGDGSHAWNVLTIGEATFHCDVQTEAGLSGGQALTCFGLSDADVARMNGWNTWTAEDHTLITCPESLMPELMGAASADVDAANNAVYFTGMEDMDGVFRLDLATGEVLQAMQDAASGVAVLGSDVYYLRAADSALCCFQTGDGQARNALEGVRVVSMRRVGSELLYVTADDPDGTEHAISME